MCKLASVTLVTYLGKQEYQLLELTQRPTPAAPGFLQPSALASPACRAPECKRPPTYIGGLCAQDWIRTSTPLPALRPEHSASTNFAIWASLICVSGSAKVKSFPDSPNSFWKKKPGFREEARLSITSAHYTDTLNSRRVSFRLVFRSVDALRWPMISAQGTWYSPAGNFLA